MPDKVECALHGECDPTFVCTHLTGDTGGLGFNREEPTAEDPFPDAWCDDCELIRAAHDGWNEESEQLSKILLLCSGCYERARIRNTRPSETLDDLATLRWKCGTCEEWHSGPCLDFSYDAPHYWLAKHSESIERHPHLSGSERRNLATFLDEDYCAIEDESFFVRGVIHLPILGTAETLRWGVWGSLSRENFQTLLRMGNDPESLNLPAMFSWLSSRIPEYPNTLNLKMYAKTRELGQRPHFMLELTDHPLAQEYHRGIAPERVREIMLKRLRVVG